MALAAIGAMRILWLLPHLPHPILLSPMSHYTIPRGFGPFLAEDDGMEAVLPTKRMKSKKRTGPPLFRGIGVYRDPHVVEMGVPPGERQRAQERGQDLSNRSPALIPDIETGMPQVIQWLQKNCRIAMS